MQLPRCGSAATTTVVVLVKGRNCFLARSDVALSRRESRRSGCEARLRCLCLERRALQLHSRHRAHRQRGKERAHCGQLRLCRGAGGVGHARLLSGSRDRAIKLIDAASGQFIDDINKLIEPVTCLARHPKEETVLYGGGEGGLRIYRAKENQERTDANNDVNLVRDFERQPGPVQAVAFNPEGTLAAAAAPNGEVRLYNPTDGKRTATLTGHDGAVFSLAFSPDGKRLYTGAFDGLIREFDPATGRLTGILQPVPILKEWVGANGRP